MTAVVDVLLTPHPRAATDVSIVVDCVRASTVVAHALSAGYRRVVCVAELEQARTVAARLPGSVLGGERDCLRVEGFALGNSPAEYREARGELLVLCTTNGTRAVMANAPRSRTLLCGALVNLDAVALAAGDATRVTVCCAGVEGSPALDDTYVAGRYVQRLIELRPQRVLTDAAAIAVATAERFASPQAALEGSASARRLRAAGLETDLEACAQLSTLDVVPQMVALTDDHAVLAADGSR